MLTLKKVAVTGGLSSGKSSVCHFFKELGAYVVSADEIVHKLLTPETIAGRRAIALLGEDIVTDGKINRSFVAAKVFKDASLLKELESFLHPAVKEETRKHYQKALESETALFVAEIPLLFETGSEQEYDYTISVIADKQESLKRFSSSTGYGEEEYQRRMARQLSPEKKCAKADFIIRNNGSLADLKQAVINIYHQINPSI
jgi:dephospho-CoA kinase